MKFLIWLLALFALATAVVLAADNTGYVLLVYPPWRVEVSLTLFVAGLVALVFVILLAIRTISATLRLPGQVRRFRAERLRAKQHAALMSALNAYFEGRLSTAEKSAEHAIELGDDTGITPIVAARAAHELRKYEKRDTYLALASDRAGATTMRLMSAAEFNLDQHHPVAALDALKALRAADSSRHVGALRLELRAQQQSGNWDAVLELTDQLSKRNGLDTVSIEQLRQQAWLEKLHRSKEIDTLHTAWKIIPVAARLHT
ncbi:MAG: heme biosynthesis protein HemY, partial [Gallionellaceae bacterium]|nr:heme biosynthesis protein HemY [Gallionellaceae bacterium]